MRRLILAALVANLLLLVVWPLAPAVGRTTGIVDEARAQATLPPLPAGWPATLQLGMSDHPGGAAGMRAAAPFGYRYQYLAGGVNTGSGWSAWNADGHFVTYYVEESVARGMTPVFSYYMIFQSRPGASGGEAASVLANLQNTATMRAYVDDLKLFFQRAGAFPSTRVILQVEPDLWGYAQQRSTGDAAASVPARVAATGAADLAGLPDTVAGVAQAVVRLRDRYAPNVQLGYHLSVWGTNVDIQLQDPSNAQIDVLAARATAFYRSLGASFDLLFAEFTDRDAGFKEQIYGDGGASWWNGADFDRNIRFIGAVVAGTGKRVVLWQIPYGNTKMRAMNNTWGHYQDNKVEWLLDDPSRANLRRYAAAGAIGLLFGGGAGGVTCPCDGEGDGVTNPAPIGGNTAMSLSADDDGGYFRQQAAAYYQAGPLAIPGSVAAPPPVPPPPAPPTPSPPTPVPPTPLPPTPAPAIPAPPTPVPPTPLPPAVSCSPRPAFSVQAVASSPGELRVTVTAGTPPGAQSNGVKALRLGGATNARVDVAGRGPVADGQLVQVATGTRQLSLTVRRVTPGLATTVPLILTDECGDWQTLVGGGPAAF